MAGHSKWANIRFRKSVQDAKRGKLWTKYIREVTISARQGANPQINPRLRLAIDKATTANIPRDTIERAIKRGAGGQEGHDVEEIRYEGYGPGGVAIMVDCMTNNRNRTISEVRHAFTKHGGNIGTEGSVAFCFHRCGQLVFPKGTSEDKLMEIGLEEGVEDIQTDEEGTVTLTTPFDHLHKINQAFEKKGFTAIRAEITFLPTTLVLISDKDTAEKVNKLIDVLEELDDVQNVYTNVEMADNLLADMG